MPTINAASTPSRNVTTRDENIRSIDNYENEFQFQFQYENCNELMNGSQQIENEDPKRNPIDHFGRFLRRIRRILRIFEHSLKCASSRAFQRHGFFDCPLGCSAGAAGDKRSHSISKICNLRGRPVHAESVNKRGGEGVSGADGIGDLNVKSRSLSKLL